MHTTANFPYQNLRHSLSKTSKSQNQLHRNLSNTEINKFTKNHSNPTSLSDTKFKKKKFRLCKSTQTELDNLSKYDWYLYNSTELFPMLKTTTLQKFVSIWLLYLAQNLKKTTSLMQIISSTTWDYSNFYCLPVAVQTTNFLFTQTVSSNCSCKNNSTEVSLMMKRTSVWKVNSNGLGNRPRDPKNRFFELWREEIGPLGLKNLQTAKLTPQKSSWRWKEQVCEKSAKAPFAFDHKIQKTSQEALRNSPTVTFSLREPSPFLYFQSEPVIAWSGHPLTRLPIKTSFKYVNRKIRGHSTPR